MIFRSITLSDHEKLIQFWKTHYFVRPIDEHDHFKAFLEKNPDLSIFVVENGEIVGTVLGSYDGRRGYIQKLVVHKDFRGKGIGKQLLERVRKKLEEVGATYIPIACEDGLFPLYQKSGFKKTSQIPMSWEK